MSSAVSAEIPVPFNEAIAMIKGEGKHFNDGFSPPKSLIQHWVDFKTHSEDD